MNSQTVSTVTTIATTDECIDAANIEFSDDLEHHLQWLARTKPGAAAAFVAALVAQLSTYKEPVVDVTQSQ